MVTTLPLNGKPRHPFWDRDDVIYVDERQREINAELIWAIGQEASGAFVEYGGKYLAIVNKCVQAVGGDTVRIINEAARKTGVPPERVVLYLVEMPLF